MLITHQRFGVRVGRHFAQGGVTTTAARCAALSHPFSTHFLRPPYLLSPHFRNTTAVSTPYPFRSVPPLLSLSRSPHSVILPASVRPPARCVVALGTDPRSTRAASATTSSATARSAALRATPSARARLGARASAGRASSSTKAGEPRPRQRCRSTADTPPPTGSGRSRR